MLFGLLDPLLDPFRVVNLGVVNLGVLSLVVSVDATRAGKRRPSVWREVLGEKCLQILKPLKFWIIWSIWTFNLNFLIRFHILRRTVEGLVGCIRVGDDLCTWTTFSCRSHLLLITELRLPNLMKKEFWSDACRDHYRVYRSLSLQRDECSLLRSLSYWLEESSVNFTEWRYWLFEGCEG